MHLHPRRSDGGGTELLRVVARDDFVSHSNNEENRQRDVRDVRVHGVAAGRRAQQSHRMEALDLCLGDTKAAPDEWLSEYGCPVEDFDSREIISTVVEILCIIET